MIRQYILLLLLVLFFIPHYSSAQCRQAVNSCDTIFVSTILPDSVKARMNGKSWHDNPNISHSELRYLQLSYVDFEGETHVGELVCNASIADDLVDIFRELYKVGYPIASMRLIDDFGADDELSMRANNTSCFCYRVIEGSSKLSNHALGMAIDINPLYNPCVWTSKSGKLIVQPSTAGPYVNRSRHFAGRIADGDMCLRLFSEHGFLWGGSWRTKKDYQHFEKIVK